jgi:hypothetical protein
LLRNSKILFKNQTTSTTGTSVVSTTTTTTTNNQHIDLAAAVHSERVVADVLERMNLILRTTAICKGGDSRPAARVNVTTTGCAQETHYLTRMMS